MNQSSQPSASKSQARGPRSKKPDTAERSSQAPGSKPPAAKNLTGELDSTLLLRSASLPARPARDGSTANQNALDHLSKIALSYIRGRATDLTAAVVIFDKPDQERILAALPNYFRQVGGDAHVALSDDQILASTPVRKFLDLWGPSFLNTCKRNSKIDGLNPFV